MPGADRTWSPHPMARPGLLLAGILQIVTAGFLLVDTALGARVLGADVRGDVLAFLLAGFAGAGLFLPFGDRFGPRRILLVSGVPSLAVLVHIALRTWTDWAPRAGWTAGGVLLAVGIVVVMASELRRRRVRLHLEGDTLTVVVRRFRLEHTLPLEAVREVTASRTLFGRLWGYGDFVARARKGTMKDRVTKPVVGESPPEDAARGNGWHDDDEFLLRAAHPYRALRRDLENRILLARLPPKEREEQELAARLSEDLDGIKA